MEKEIISSRDLLRAGGFLAHPAGGGSGPGCIVFCRSDWRKRIPIVAAGLLLPVLIFGLVDAFTQLHPFQSFYMYFYTNLIQRRSAAFGVKRGIGTCQDWSGTLDRCCFSRASAPGDRHFWAGWLL